jgi:hypothetical protein
MREHQQDPWDQFQGLQREYRHSQFHHLIPERSGCEYRIPLHQLPMQLFPMSQDDLAEIF